MKVHHLWPVHQPTKCHQKIGRDAPRQGFSQVVVMKLVDDQRVVFSQTLASLYDKDIAIICKIIQRPGGLLSGKMPDRMSQISFLAMKNLKSMALMIKMLECSSKNYNIKCFNNTSVLQ